MMARNNARFFVDDDMFYGLDTSGTTNNMIVIGPIEYSMPSTATAVNPVYCSFRGVPLTQVAETELDDANAEGSFAYVSIPTGNFIKIAVSKVAVPDMQIAKNYVRGLLVDYQLTNLTRAGTCKEPLYEVSTYLSDGTLVSPTVACGMPDIVRKIQALEANLDINEVGYYEHVIRVALVKK